MKKTVPGNLPTFGFSVAGFLLVGMMTCKNAAACRMAVWSSCIYLCVSKVRGMYLELCVYLKAVSERNEDDEEEEEGKKI